MQDKRKALINKDPALFDTLVDVIACLRGPNGCPWDQKQTHQSIRDSLLEETHEVLQALDGGSSNQVKEELGDLLLQVVLHAQIAKDNGEFEISQVIRHINEKLIRRHPHVFDATLAGDVKQVLENWEEIKKNERKKGTSMLNGVPPTLPSLAYSQALQKRVARVGFDWDTDEGVIEKITEEVCEISQAQSKEEKEREYGDLLFTLANFARRQGIDLESALRGSNHRFYERFSAMEEICHQKGIEFKSLTYEEKNKLWEEVKDLSE